MSRFPAMAVVFLVSLGCSKPATPNPILPPEPIIVKKPDLFLDPLDPLSRPFEEKMEDQKRVENLKWTWNPKEADLLYCIKKELPDYRTEFIAPKDGIYGSVRIMEDGKEIYAFQCGEGTVFTRKGNVLFVAKFPRMSGGGCGVHAYDFKAKKELWTTGVRGRDASHSFYWNDVTITTSDDAIVVKGKETQGNYIQYLNAETGKTIGRKEFPAKD